jgi:hypothetical protein
MLNEFRWAWNSGDVEAVADQGSTPNMRERLVRGLPDTQKRYGWGWGLPPVDDPIWQEGETRLGVRWARATFPGEAGKLKIRLEYASGRWGVTSLAWRSDKALGASNL